MRARLIPIDGSPPLDVTKELSVVGRKETCDLRLDHKSVSKLHCVIVKTDGLLLLRDLGSTNGTKVNNQKVRRAALLLHDQLNIANFIFKVFIGPDDGPVGPTEATQQMDAKEVARLVEQYGHSIQDKTGDSELDSDIPFKLNPLPDAYPEEEKRKEKEKEKEK
jgi:pSer/pThr/pTyr-binding forkhead associated (FHA) protein